MENIFEGEPYLGKKKKPKTQKERTAEALILSAKGHLVSPLGKPKRKGAHLKPSMAKAVKDVGNITIHQLWATYVDLFGKAFGLPDLLQQVMADTKENVSRFFDDLRQRFLECTGVLPDNRDLHEYLIWFHRPEHLKPLFKSNKLGYVHPNQLKGIVHIKMFYEEVLKKKDRNGDFVSERVANQRQMTSFVMSAYEKLRSSDPSEHVYCIVNYGYVIFAEFLHDYNGHDASACRKRVIECMAELIRAATDKKKAVEFLSYAWKATENNEKCFTSAVWPDWRESCKDMIEVATKLAEEK